MTLRVLIVDDEAVARRRIRRLLAAEQGVAVVGECADGRSALPLLSTERADLVFLDVQMPELDGFEVLQRVDPSTLPAIVFVTAHDRYALEAFDLHAVDYLLKPFSSERFRTALVRARERVERRAGHEAVETLVAGLERRSRYLTRVGVRTAGRIRLLELETVDWIEAADNYVTLHVAGKEHLLRETLATLERQLDPDRFARIHRRAIVQIDRITELRPATHGDFSVRLRDGTCLTLSRTRRAQLGDLLR